MRHFPPPWTVEKIPGGLKVVDANGQSLAYVYSREKPDDAHIAKVLTEDEARRIAANIAKAINGWSAKAIQESEKRGRPEERPPRIRRLSQGRGRRFPPQLVCLAS
jgi:hypothetical protein